MQTVWSPWARLARDLAKFVYIRESQIFDQPSIYFTGVIKYSGHDAIEEWLDSRVTGGVFSCFGIPVILGRGFDSADTQGNTHVALISQAIWERRFVRDPHILGQTISLNGESYTVIGVAGDVSAIRRYGPTRDVYLPFPIDPATTDQTIWVEVIARLKPGVTLEQARARLRASTAGYRAKFPGDLSPKESFTLRPFRDELVGGDRPVPLFLSGAVCLVLLIACANAANLSQRPPSVSPQRAHPA